jgi:hypothetical protein
VQPKSTEDRELEGLLLQRAQQAQGWQQIITNDQDLEKWVSDGHWDYLRRKILDEIEREAFRTIKNPAFDPSDYSQVAQFKALCQTIDLIEARIKGRINAVAQARTLLNDLERATQKEGA